MKRIHHYDDGIKGRLYLIPTPIGHLDDMTFRAVNTLRTVDVLYAEDTRVSSHLLKHFEISRPLTSLHEHNEETRKHEVLRHLNDHRDVGIISDAGSPLMSDPGYTVVRAAINENHPVIALPGANAIVPALAMSGLPPHPSMFLGFLPTRKKARQALLGNVRHVRATLVIYESPRKLEGTLNDLIDVLGNREAALLREMSKRHEESLHGDLRDLADAGPFRGECVLIVAGASDDVDVDVDVIEQVDFFIASGDKKTTAMKKVSAMTGIPKNKIYKTYIEKKLK